jgi:hypothetical protein
MEENIGPFMKENPHPLPIPLSNFSKINSFKKNYNLQNLICKYSIFQKDKEKLLKTLNKLRNTLRKFSL